MPILVRVSIATVKYPGQKRLGEKLTLPHPAQRGKKSWQGLKQGGNLCRGQKGVLLTGLFSQCAPPALLYTPGLPAKGRPHLL